MILIVMISFFLARIHIGQPFVPDIICGLPLVVVFRVMMFKLDCEVDQVELNGRITTRIFRSDRRADRDVSSQERLAVATGESTVRGESVAHIDDRAVYLHKVY